jgi:hypothetical protein
MPSPDSSPFVGHSLTIRLAFTGQPPATVEVDCLEHSYGFLKVQPSGGPVYWINVRHIADIEVDGGDAPASATSLAAMKFPDLESKYGAVEIKVADEAETPAS